MDRIPREPTYAKAEDCEAHGDELRTLRDALNSFRFAEMYNSRERWQDAANKCRAAGLPAWEALATTRITRAKR